MPSLEKHIENSVKRTGSEFRELHEWLDGPKTSIIQRIQRHNTIKISVTHPITLVEVLK